MVGGRGRSGNGGRQQKQLNSETPCDLKIPRTLEPLLPVVWQKKVFCFFRSSASGKQHLSYSSSQKQLEKASMKNMMVLHLC